MLTGTAPAVKSSAGTNQRHRACRALPVPQSHSHPGVAYGSRRNAKLSSSVPGSEGFEAEHPTACGKRAARRTERVSQDIQPHLVTGKEPGATRTEHKANSSTTVRSERQGTARAHGPSPLRKTPHALISPRGENLFQPRLFVYSANFVA